MGRPRHHPDWNRPGLHIHVARESIDTEEGVLAWDPQRSGTDPRRRWKATLNGWPIDDVELVFRGLIASVA